ncbi:Acetylornithine aminotransferase [Sulfurovum sp. enrichment culture clone C5]|uniref:Acetylornithine aminotransferase n=1 Tax=Sulfurovum sp. enrichment culture clone C5 TaxID=497650 RepID=A0A0S4XND7_9BACT|nr:Acetylornithine aminotransferase [Sulfurovum sp. enrichment culture clone C5]
MTLEELDKKYVLHTYARDYTNFTYGVGSTLYDESGKDYIDFASGIGVNSVGHGNEKLANAICEQAKKIIHISNLQVIEPQAKLAEKIALLYSDDVGVFFSNSGAEANEGAIKLARKYGEISFPKKRYKILTLENSFHGRTLATVKATGQDSFHPSCFAPYIDGFSYVKTLKDVENALDDETVAVMIELIKGEGGVAALPKDEVQHLVKVLKEKNVLLIVDEVQSGVFRSGEFLASQVYGIKPDIITLAKGLAGGVPIGAIVTPHKDVFVAGDHGSTFGGNYLSTAAGNTALEILNNIKESGQLSKTIAYFEDKLQTILKENSDKFEAVTGLGLMRGLKAKSSEIQVKTIKQSLKEGVIVLKSGNNTVRFLPSLTITKDEIDEGFARFEKALSNI